MSEGLFRKQAVEFSTQRSLGKVTFIQPLSVTLLSLFVGSIAVFSLVFLWHGEYARKEAVQGYLEPGDGLVSVYSSSKPAVVRKLSVIEGQLVLAGAPLVRLGHAKILSGGDSENQTVINELLGQKQELLLQWSRTNSLYDNKRKNLTVKISDAKNELAQLGVFSRLQSQSIKVKSQLLDAMNKLSQNGAVSEFKRLQMVSEKLDQEKQGVSIGSKILQARALMQATIQQLKLLPTQRQSELHRWQMQISTISQKLASTAIQEDELILSPIRGRVTAIQAKLGVTIAANQQLLTIVPTQSLLEGVLLIPTTAVAFVEVGQSIHLKIDAFPYQQYGSVSAKLVSLSQAAVVPHELKSPVTPQGPVFIAKVQLHKQDFYAQGADRPLLPNMLLKADIVLQPRNLIEWILEPLYRLRGRQS